MNTLRNRLLLLAGSLLALAAICTTASAQNGGGSTHSADMNERGEQVMGFSQTRATHHFVLSRDGGLIQVGRMNRAIQRAGMRLENIWHTIAKMFSDGDFNAPMLIHAQTPPGVPEMKRLKGKISYKFQQTNRGGQVRISTRDPQALAAVHDFLRFQIREHQTGDPLKVSD
jgi:hypothetical protein